VAVNEHDWLIKYNFLVDSLFNSFKLFNCLLGLAQFKQTLRNARVQFDVLVSAKAKNFCGHANILVLFVLTGVLNPIVKQLAHLDVAGQTFLKLLFQQQALTLQSK
jgi:hypothetical protein